MCPAALMSHRPGNVSLFGERFCNATRPRAGSTRDVHRAVPPFQRVGLASRHGLAGGLRPVPVHVERRSRRAHHVEHLRRRLRLRQGIRIKRRHRCSEGLSRTRVSLIVFFRDDATREPCEPFPEETIFESSSDFFGGPRPDLTLLRTREQHGSQESAPQPAPFDGSLRRARVRYRPDRSRDCRRSIVSARPCAEPSPEKPRASRASLVSPDATHPLTHDRSPRLPRRSIDITVVIEGVRHKLKGKIGKSLAQALAESNDPVLQSVVPEVSLRQGPDTHVSLPATCSL